MILTEKGRIMKHLKITLGILLLIFGIGCGSGDENGVVQEVGIIVESPDTKQTQDLVIERKLIKKGEVEFETKDINSRRTTIFGAIEKFDGYISSDREYKSKGRISNPIVIRVPAKNFDNLFDEATKGVDKFDDKEIEVKDVTEEFLDVQARLKTKKELETRYLDLLKKANSVTDILEIEKQIGLLRTEIESIEGRLRYLKDRVALSTLTMTFYEKIYAATEFGSKFKSGFRHGYENLIWFLVGLTNIWPFIILVILAIFGIRRLAKRKN